MNINILYISFTLYRIHLPHILKLVDLIKKNYDRIFISIMNCERKMIMCVCICYHNSIVITLFIIITDQNNLLLPMGIKKFKGLALEGCFRLGTQHKPLEHPKILCGSLLETCDFM